MLNQTCVQIGVNLELLKEIFYIQVLPSCRAVDPLSTTLLAPDPGGKILRKNRRNAWKLEVIVILFLKIKSKFGPAPWCLIIKQ